jgi:hypothetical protein
MNMIKSHFNAWPSPEKRCPTEFSLCQGEGLFLIDKGDAQGQSALSVLNFQIY